MAIVKPTNIAKEIAAAKKKLKRSAKMSSRATAAVSTAAPMTETIARGALFFFLMCWTAEDGGKAEDQSSEKVPVIALAKSKTRRRSCT